MTTAGTASTGQESLSEPRAGLHLLALLGGNMALALGPYFVRVADSGPVSAGFWRLFLSLPVLALLAVGNRQALALPRRVTAGVALAGVLFALDLASWHVGIEHTRLGNASLFGNAGSLILMVWALVQARRGPRPVEATAMALALAGSAILLGRSLEIDRSTLMGDLFCILAGFFYFFFIILLQSGRGHAGAWTLLFTASLAGAPVMLAIGWLGGEPVWPATWWPLVALALCSQVIGQGLLVYALRHFPALIVGLALLTQPVLSILAGWLAFGETVGPVDIAGMLMVGAALVLARLGDQGRA